jgi:hypothetical protein
LLDKTIPILTVYSVVCVLVAMALNGISKGLYRRQTGTIPDLGSENWLVWKVALWIVAIRRNWLYLIPAAVFGNAFGLCWGQLAQPSNQPVTAVTIGLICATALVAGVFQVALTLAVLLGPRGIVLGLALIKALKEREQNEGGKGSKKG